MLQWLEMAVQSDRVQTPPAAPKSAPPLPGLALVVVALSSTCFGTLCAQTASRPLATHPAEWFLEQEASRLRPDTAPKPPSELLEAARKAVQTGLTEERAQALMTLGLAGHQSDQALLSNLVGKLDDRVSEHAAIALGFLGGPSTMIQLSQFLQGRNREDSRKRTIAALALGLTEDKDPEHGARLSLNMFVQSLMERNFDIYASEIAAAFVGFGPDSGRAVYRSLLEGRNQTIKRVISGPYLQPRRVTDPAAHNLMLLRGITVGLLARQVSSLDEVQLVLNRIKSSTRYDLARYRAIYGLWVGGGKYLDKKLREKVTRVLAKTLSDSSPEIAAMALLAYAKFDQDVAVKRARNIVRNKRTRSRLLAPSMLLLGKHGGADDKELLARQAERHLADINSAALSIAMTEMALRLTPEAWPVAASATKKVADPPFPVRELRANLDMADRLRPTIREAAAAVCLARLGDVNSTSVIRGLYLSANNESLRRSLAMALVHLDPKALDAAKPADDDAAADDLAWDRMTALAYAGHPRLWDELMGHVAGPKTSSTQRAQAFRLAAIALASNGGSLGQRIFKRLGPGSLPEPLEDIATW